MKEIQTETRIVLKDPRCPACNNYHEYGNRPEFCDECGQSLMARKTFQLCPLCGEDLTPYHLADAYYLSQDELHIVSCDGFDQGATFLTFVGDDYLVRDKDEDLWLVERAQIYDVCEASINPIRVHQARTTLELYARKLRIEADQLDKASKSLKE
jgi:hypothetical protein